MTAYATPEPINTPTTMAFHQQVQAALPHGLQVTTSGSTSGFLSATVCDAAGRELAFCCGGRADVLAQIEAQRSQLTQPASLPSPAAMTATSESAAFRARIQHQRRAAHLPMARPFLTTPEVQAKQATLALLAAAANRARARYEAATISLAFAAYLRS